MLKNIILLIMALTLLTNVNGQISSTIQDDCDFCLPVGWTDWQTAGSQTLKNGNIFVKEFIDVTNKPGYSLSVNATGTQNADNLYLFINYIKNNKPVEACKFIVLYLPAGAYLFTTK